MILPDSKSSARWETADRKYLEAAFKAAGVEYDIQNAQGDKTQFQTIADQMITSGVNVLMIVNLDSGTGKAVLDKAKAAGRRDHRLRPPDPQRRRRLLRQLRQRGGRQAAGRGPGQVPDRQEARRTPVIAELNGSPTDNNATLFKQGYDSVLKPKYDAEEYTKGPDQSVPDWDNAQAGTIFEQMLTETDGKIDGVLAANDGLGNAAIAVLKKNKPQRQGPGHRPGRDRAGPAEHPRRRPVHDGLQGDQEGGRRGRRRWPSRWPRARSATGHRHGQGHRDAARTSRRSCSTPQAITKDNVKDVVADGFVTKDELCTGDFAAKCTEAGIELTPTSRPRDRRRRRRAGARLGRRAGRDAPTPAEEPPT